MLIHLFAPSEANERHDSRVQFKRAIHLAGKRFTPRAEFRNRLQRVASQRRHNFRLGWILMAAAVIVLVVGTLT